MHPLKLTDASRLARANTSIFKVWTPLMSFKTCLSAFGFQRLTFCEARGCPREARLPTLRLHVLLNATHLRCCRIVPPERCYPSVGSRASRGTGVTPPNDDRVLGHAFECASILIHHRLPQSVFAIRIRNFWTKFLKAKVSLSTIQVKSHRLFSELNSN